MSEILANSRTPPCTNLLYETKEILGAKERWPAHLCYDEFMCESTRLWAEEQPFVGLNANIIWQWSTMHPLPIGRRALLTRRDVDDLLEWAEVSSILPFAEYQTAMWALRVKGEWSATNEYVLDLFGLAEYPTETHQEYSIPVAGDLAYVVRGRAQEQFPFELLHVARRWWSQFKGRLLRGRPPNSGVYSSAQELREAIDRAGKILRLQNIKPTQERVASELRTTDRQLRNWLSQFRLEWKEIRESL